MALLYISPFLNLSFIFDDIAFDDPIVTYVVHVLTSSWRMEYSAMYALLMSQLEQHAAALNLDYNFTKSLWTRFENVKGHSIDRYIIWYGLVRLPQHCAGLLKLSS